MKRILFAIGTVLTISASVYCYTQKQNAITLNDLAMANIEALASGESSSIYEERPCSGLTGGSQCVTRYGDRPACSSYRGC